jgi:NHS family xanthosine MFS transporter
MNSSLKYKLIAISFMQFYVWGAWLITMADYWFATKNWDGTKFGAVFSTMGIASVFMPTVVGLIADRWINAERIYGFLHIAYAGVLFYIPQVNDPDSFFFIMLLAMIFYMPTIALTNSISYSLIKGNGGDVVKDYPPIRVWGTIGFIVAMWVTNLSGSKDSVNQFYIAGVCAFLLGFGAFFLPKCPPQIEKSEKKSTGDIFGLKAFKLFGNYKMALFFVFSMFLGGALQLTNAYGDVFLSEFKNYPIYAESLVVKYSTIIMSISQISETLFILAIPFFLRRFGIKQVMLFSMLAWVLRFGTLAYGDPNEGLWLIIFSCVVYGMAFDFFNISGSLFVETNTTSDIRSSAQGLFMMVTNGFGAILGSISAGWLIDNYMTNRFTKVSDLAQHLNTSADNPVLGDLLKQKEIIVQGNLLNKEILLKDWPTIWLSFASYALVIAILFFVLFKHKHDPEKLNSIHH